MGWGQGAERTIARGAHVLDCSCCNNMFSAVELAVLQTSLRVQQVVFHIPGISSPCMGAWQGHCKEEGWLLLETRWQRDVGAYCWRQQLWSSPVLGDILGALRVHFSLGLRAACMQMWACHLGVIHAERLSMLLVFDSLSRVAAAGGEMAQWRLICRVIPHSEVHTCEALHTVSSSGSMELGGVAAKDVPVQPQGGNQLSPGSILTNSAQLVLFGLRC
jgi:hypothetical protein